MFSERRCGGGGGGTGGQVSIVSPVVVSGDRARLGPACSLAACPSQKVGPRLVDALPFDVQDAVCQKHFSKTVNVMKFQKYRPSVLI